jgi:hypothetical protein
MKHLIMQFSPISRHFIPLRTKFNYTQLEVFAEAAGDKIFSGNHTRQFRTANISEACSTPSPRNNVTGKHYWMYKTSTNLL